MRGTLQVLHDFNVCVGSVGENSEEGKVGSGALLTRFSLNPSVEFVWPASNV